jgi:hypothetical protein
MIIALMLVSMLFACIGLCRETPQSGHYESVLTVAHSRCLAYGVVALTALLPYVKLESAAYVLNGSFTFPAIFALEAFVCLVIRFVRNSLTDKFEAQWHASELRKADESHLL